MASDRKHKQSNSIPIRFFDENDPRAAEDDAEFEERVEDSDPGAEPAVADARASDMGFGGPGVKVDKPRGVACFRGPPVTVCWSLTVWAAKAWHAP